MRLELPDRLSVKLREEGKLNYVVDDILFQTIKKGITSANEELDIQAPGDIEVINRISDFSAPNPDSDILEQYYKGKVLHLYRRDPGSGGGKKSKRKSKKRKRDVGKSKRRKSKRKKRRKSKTRRRRR